jgi:hypothetical protein
MVGSLMGTEAYFCGGGSGGIESHFGVGHSSDGARDGQVRQWRDTEEQADANYHANLRPDGTGAVSIETSDGGNPNQRWSPKQADSLVRLGRWLADTHNIPKRLCRNPSDPGFGYHSMFGCPSPWCPNAKGCPNPTRIRQLRDEVLPRIFAAGPIEEEDMPYSDWPQADKDALIEDIKVRVTDPIYRLLARGEGGGQIHYNDSNRGVKELINEHADELYRLLARGEMEGIVNPDGEHFLDSNRHLRELLEELTALVSSPSAI